MNPSRAEFDRLHSVRHRRVNVTKERAAGWRRLVVGGYAELIKIPGIDLWVAQSTEAGRILADAHTQRLQAEAYAIISGATQTSQGANLREW